MTLQTDRFMLPLLATAQAQKELTHNEALALLDALVHSVVVAVAPPTVPGSPAPGQCWIVGVGATGAWTGHDGALAAWTQGGWRFVTPVVGMSVWSVDGAVLVRRTASGWIVGPAVAAPSGGAVVDADARSAIATLTAAMRLHGLITA